MDGEEEIQRGISSHVTDFLLHVFSFHLIWAPRPNPEFLPEKNLPTVIPAA